MGGCQVGTPNIRSMKFRHNGLGVKSASVWYPPGNYPPGSLLELEVPECKTTKRILASDDPTDSSQLLQLSGLPLRHMK